MQNLKQCQSYEITGRKKSFKNSQNWLLSSLQTHMESQMGYECWEAIRRQCKSITRMGNPVQIKLE